MNCWRKKTRKKNKRLTSSAPYRTQSFCHPLDTCRRVVHEKVNATFRPHTQHPQSQTEPNRTLSFNMGRYLCRSETRRARKIPVYLQRVPRSQSYFFGSKPYLSDTVLMILPSFSSSSSAAAIERSSSCVSFVSRPSPSTTEPWRTITSWTRSVIRDCSALSLEKKVMSRDCLTAGGGQSTSFQT